MPEPAITVCGACRHPDRFHLPGWGCQCCGRDEPCAAPGASVPSFEEAQW